MPLGLLPAIKGLGRPGRCSGVAAPQEQSAPPRGFRDAQEVRAAWPCGEGPFARTSTRGGTPAQRAGKRYEKKALSDLKKGLGEDFQEQPWFRFTTSLGETRWCQPDGILISESASLLFECKVTYTPDAWWQMRRLYVPVLKRAFLIDEVLPVLVCKHFDPAIPFPEPVHLLADLQAVKEWAREGNPNMTGVYQWAP